MLLLSTPFQRISSSQMSNIRRRTWNAQENKWNEQENKNEKKIKTNPPSASEQSHAVIFNSTKLADKKI